MDDVHEQMFNEENLHLNKDNSATKVSAHMLLCRKQKQFCIKIMIVDASFFTFFIWKFPECNFIFSFNFRGVGDLSIIVLRLLKN